jgi:hypothetical protein
LGSYTSGYKNLSLSILIHSIVLLVLIGGFASDKVNIIFGILIIFGIDFSLLVHYFITLSKMNKIDLPLLRYSAQYNCSDGPL